MIIEHKRRETQDFSSKRKKFVQNLRLQILKAMKIKYQVSALIFVAHLSL